MIGDTERVLGGIRTLEALVQVRAVSDAALRMRARAPPPPPRRRSLVERREQTYFVEVVLFCFKYSVSTIVLSFVDVYRILL